MSYEIIYDKQFIKLNDEAFVPMLFWGSNNCTEWGPGGRERRARSWSAWTYPCIEGKAWNSPQGFLDKAEAMKNEWYERYANEGETLEDFEKYHFGSASAIAIGSGSYLNGTYGRFKGIFKTGCQKALTIEQLAEEDVLISINSYAWGNKYEEQGVERRSEFPKTGEEFIKAWNELKEYYKDTDVSISVSYTGMYESSPKRLRKKYFPVVRKRKSWNDRVEVDHYWTVKRDGHYFVRKTKWGYKYTHYAYLKFRTEAEAHNRIRRYNSSAYTVERVDEKATI